MDNGLRPNLPYDNDWLLGDAPAVTTAVLGRPRPGSRQAVADY